MIKKIFAIVAIAAAFAACNTEGTTPNGGDDVCKDCQKNPCECEEITTAISIDGDFADWDNLEGVVVATCPKDDVAYEQFKTFKVYADEEFIYIFCEFDPENTLVFVPYFDLDNDEYLILAIDYYHRLNAFDDDVLEEADFERDEVRDGLMEFMRKCGIPDDAMAV